jgi:hypothetical protein
MTTKKGEEIPGKNAVHPELILNVKSGNSKPSSRAVSPRSALRPSKEKILKMVKPKPSDLSVDMAASDKKSASQKGDTSVID